MVNPFHARFPPAPHLIPSGLPNQSSKPNTPGTPPPTNPNIPPYATRAFPSTRQSVPSAPPASPSPVSSFIGQQQQQQQHTGLYGQQQILYQQRPTMPPFGSNNPMNPQQNTMPGTSTAPPFGPPSMPGAFQPQNTYYNPNQQYFQKS